MPIRILLDGSQGITFDLCEFPLEFRLFCFDLRYIYIGWVRADQVRNIVTDGEKR